MQYLKKILNVLLLGLCGVSILSCSEGMSKEELAIESKRCEERTTLDKVRFSLKGFKFEDVNPVTVQRLKNNRVVEEFTIVPSTNSNDLHHSAEANRPFYIGETYQFIVKNEPPFVLTGWKNFAFIPPVREKSVMCSIVNIVINGVKGSDGAVILKKKGYLTPGQRQQQQMTPAEEEILKMGGSVAKPDRPE